ncbi:HAMP domain-containing sensor histidine kinase [Flavivirga amylovorans]|uniref:histidine kinase n=1 Tax=Flavivirga amylovorans TaxID=870486 RepID=A0ABT8WYL8_9FLAO|nr:HAMP domain-containing sensor histidine kinase [Flavivirga amylovorans]MDO5986774.1 HAMP domain-containing sensor histidine kinase [Flavivirga amylovorans]
MILTLLVLMVFTLTVLLLMYDKHFRKNEDAFNKQLKQQNYQIDSLTSTLKCLKFVKEVLVPVVSHDYRSPLVCIKSTLLRIQMDDNYNETELKNNLKVLNNQVDSTLGFVDDMLLCTKNKLTDANSDLCDISIAWLINKNIDLMQQSIFEKQLNVVINLSEVLHEKQVIAVSVVDITIRNLLSNAVKVAPTSSTITIAGSTQDGHLVISVKDEGKGLTAYEIAHLFSQSSQKTSLLHLDRSLPMSSWGVGLQLVKELLDSCEGKIWVESNNKYVKGATFSFMVPLH